MKSIALTLMGDATVPADRMVPVEVPILVLLALCLFLSLCLAGSGDAELRGAGFGAVQRFGQGTRMEGAS